MGSDPIEVTPPPSLLAPWEVPPDELYSQRLFRMELESGERSGSLRLTLRLAEPDQFLLTAVDPLGRRLWTLQVSGSRTVWLDHRRETVCRGDDAPPPFLGGLTVAGLPAVLLGRLPERPGDAQAVQWWQLEGGQRQLRYADDGGRLWTARVGTEGELRTWSSQLDPQLLDGLEIEDKDGQDDIVRWQQEGAGATLRDPQHQLEARWRETLREPLEPGTVLEPLVAGDYREIVCGFDRRALDDDTLSGLLPEDAPRGR